MVLLLSMSFNDLLLVVQGHHSLRRHDHGVKMSGQNEEKLLNFIIYSKVYHLGFVFWLCIGGERIT